MPANTPIYNFPYPLGTDPVAQGDNDIRALAEDVETVISTNVASLSTAIPRQNLLYNGAMQVHQRGIVQTLVNGSAYYTADRWATSMGLAGDHTQSVEVDAPAGTGLAKSLKIDQTFAIASPSSSALLNIQQRLEAQDCQAIKKGTTEAQSLTLSFWVKSNVIGTYIAELTDSPNSRTVSLAYTVTSPDTWERKVITFPADTVGTLPSNASTGLTIVFYLMAGSNYQSGTLQTSWGSLVTANRAVGQVNLCASVGNYWQMTGAMLSVGSQAAPFEYRTYGEELALCQRYYEQSSAAPILLSSTGTEWSPAIDARALTSRLFFKATKRVAPTVAIYNTNSGSVSTVSEYTSGPGTFVTNRPASAYSPTTQSFMVISVAQFAAGRQYNFTWTANAEL